MGDRRARGWLATGFVVLAAATWVLLGTGGRKPAETEVPPTPADRPEAPALGIDDATRDLVPPAEAGASASDAAGVRPEVREALDGPSEEHAARPTVLVRVVRSTDGTPLAGALVRLLDSTTVARDETTRFLSDGGSVHDLLERYGTAYRADDDGETRVPVPVGSGLASARADGWFGFAPAAWTGEVFVLEALPDPPLLVEVAEASGAPAVGVPVYLELLDGEDAHVLYHRRTDADGRVRFRGLPALLATSRPNGVERLRVRAGAPGVPELVADVPADLADAEPVRWTLPAHGVLEVVLEQGVAEPRVALSSRPFPFDDVPARWRDGGARFDHVGVGQRFVLRVLADGFEPWMDLVDGPRAAGEVARHVVTLVPTTRSPERLQLLVAGRPLTSAVVEVEALGATGSSRTDADGFLELDDWNRHAGESATLFLRHEPPDGTAPLEGSCRPGDATEVHLLPVPLAVSGRVLDRHGRPRAGARVSLLPRDDSLLMEATAGRLLSVASRSTADGRFRLYGPREPFALYLVVNDPVAGYASLAVDYGQEDVVVRLPGVCALHGRVEGPFDDVAHWVNAFVEIEGSEYAVRVEEDRRFRREGLPPGAATLLFRTRFGAPLLRVEGLLLAPDETLDDPRLTSIDLSDSVREYVVEARTVDGVRASGELHYDVGDEHDPRRVELREGTARLWAATPVERLSVRCAGSRFVTVEAPTTHEVVTLPPPIRVHLRLTGAVPDLGDRGWLAVFLASEDGGRRERFGGVVDAGGLATFEAGAPGAYLPTMQLRLQRDAGLSPIRLEVEPTGWESLAIPEDATELDLELPVPEEPVRKLLARF